MKRVKPSGTLSVSDYGNANIPKTIREELNIEKGTIAYVVSAHAAVLFNPDVEPETLIKSLKILVEDLKLRVSDEGEKDDDRKKIQSSNQS
jgi:bifunctional DNA-binding transcriptional regulator/antitoxin component of YhaV-PrlF toxin-antitoxin module